MRCSGLNCHLTRLASDTRSEVDSSLMFFLVGRGVGDLVRSGYNLGHINTLRINTAHLLV